MIKDFFSFHSIERKGIAVLLFLCILVLIGNLLTIKIGNNVEIDFHSLDSKIDSFELAVARLIKVEKYNSPYKKSIYDKSNYYKKKRYKYVEKKDTVYSLKKNYSPNSTTFHYKTLTVEVNTADTTELKKIYGIGSYLAKGIVKYRKWLGGYHSIQQLKEVYGFDRDTMVFEKIKSSVFINTSIRKININFCTAKELAYHPYCNWKNAKRIVYYRTRNGAFESTNELLTQELLSDSVFLKLSPYLKVEN